MPPFIQPSYAHNEYPQAIYASVFMDTTQMRDGYTVLGIHDDLSRIHLIYRFKEITPGAVCQAFQQFWIQRYGPPSVITCDRNTIFESSLFLDFCQQSGSHIEYYDD